jgi:hypothetical protein
MREPLLFVRDDNYVDKEYEEPNERGVVVKRGAYFLLVREHSFQQWIGKALLPFTWQNIRRSESTLKEEN